MVITIVAASLNPAKVTAVSEAAKIYWEQPRILSVSVSSNVSNMPMSKSETRLGAKNRAINALKHQKADLAVAHEGGVCVINGDTHLFSSCIATDGTEFAYGGETLIKLPQSIVDEIADGSKIELGDIIERRSGIKDARKHTGATAYLTNGTIKRVEIFTINAIMALAYFGNNID